MTPELTFGGGYAGSLGNIGYGYDGACTCMYTDTADVAFDPGDTSQMRLTYASGPFSMAVAVEDGGYNNAFGSDEDGDLRFGEDYYDDSLGASGEIKYSGDMFSGEIAGVWRGQKEENYLFDTTPDPDFYNGPANPGILTGDGDVEALWQIGAGVGFALGDMINVSVGAAMGEGPATVVDDGELLRGLPLNNDWWGVSALARINMTDQFYAEIAGGYKNREGDFDLNYNDFNGDNWNFDSFDYETWAVMGGLYYNPVDQLTIGLEGEWYTAETEVEGREVTVGGGFEVPVDKEDQDTIKIDTTTDTFIAAFVARWSF
jgi:opacity protein-like surface antigen